MSLNEGHLGHFSLLHLSPDADVDLGPSLGVGGGDVAHSDGPLEAGREGTGRNLSNLGGTIGVKDLCAGVERRNQGGCG